MNIGFDLDKIFINTPPFVPGKIIEWLYKDEPNETLRYRIPGKTEQIIRLITHHPFFRPIITKNMDYIKNFSLTNKNKYYVISSRFGFLKKKTTDLIKRYNLDKIFDAMYFNYSNNQPHEFKDEMVKKLNLDMYVDDDLDLLQYLVNKNPDTNFFWLNKKISKPLNKNLFAIKHISEMFK